MSKNNYKKILSIESWDDFCDISKELSKDDDDKTLEDYYTAISIEREGIGKSIYKFINQPEKRVLIVAAESGLGKTYLFRHYYLTLPKEGHAVIFFSGSTYNGKSISNFILNKINKNYMFNENFEDLLKKLSEIKKEPERFVILFDAVNEYDKHEELVKKIFEFSKTIDINYTWVKIIFNIRTFFVKELYRTLSYYKKTLFYSKVDNPGKERLYIELSEFDEAELETAFKKYKDKYGLKNSFNDLSPSLKESLKYPLIMKLSSENYRKDTLPNENISLPSSIKKFMEKKITKGDDVGLIDLITETMWENRTDFLYTKSNSSEISEITENESFKNLQKIIQKTTNKENAITTIRFTLDRFFEYQMKIYLKRKYQKRLNKEDGSIIYDLVEKIRGKYIFYVVIKNILSDMLANSRNFDKEKDDFWCELISYTQNDENSEKVNIATKQILTSTLEAYCNVDKKFVIKFLFRITINKNERTMLIALDVLMSIVSEIEEELINDYFINILDRGLRFSNKKVRFETSKVLLALFNRNSPFKEIVLERLSTIKEDIESNIKGLKILKCLSFNQQRIIKEQLDSFIGTTLFITSQHFSNTKIVDSDTEIVDRILKNCADLIRCFTKTPIFFIIKKIFINIIRNKLSEAYKEQRSFACNYIEMHIVYSKLDIFYEIDEIDYLHAIDEIGILFQKNLSELELNKEMKDKIEKLINIENGLINWYVYSFLALYAQNCNDDVLDQLFEFIKSLFEKYYDEESISCTIVHALWIMTEFSKFNVSKKAKIFYEQYAKNYLYTHGGWVTYKHHIKKDKTIIEYLNKDDNVYLGSYRVRYCEETEHLICEYNNTILLNYSIYLMRTHSTDPIDFIIELLESKNWNECEKDKADRFLVYIIEVLGEIGERFPETALNTMEYIIKKNKNDLIKIIENEYNNKKTTLKDVIKKSLLQIKKYFPKQVDDFIETLYIDVEVDKDKEEYRVLFKDITLTNLETEFDKMLSYYGEFIYQKSFLNFPAIPKIFGKGMQISSKKNTVGKQFKAFIKEFIAHFEKNL